VYGRSLCRALAGACMALAIMAATAAGASATSLWVSSSTPVSSPYDSCAHPGYSTVQAAIAAAGPGATVDVCTGVFVEQLTITKPLKLNAVNGAGTAKVVLPEAPTDSKTPCDEAPGTGSYQPDQDGVSICTSGTVRVTGMTFEPKWPAGRCYDSLYGILVAGGATLKATNMTVDGGGAFPINGCQGGVGIQVGMAWTTPVEVGHATLSQDKVADYQKNGITVDGSGSSAKIGDTSVTGAGATPETAQNGIQVSNGAVAKIASSSVAGNECDNATCGADAFSDYQATGILFYGAAPGSKVTSTTLKENDIGVYLYSESPTQPSSPEVSLAKDLFSGNRYEGLTLDQGDASVKQDTIDGPGNIGIDLFQYEEQSYAPNSSAAKDRIEGMSEAAVKVESDKQPGDHAGSFTIANSTFSGDAQVLVDESETFTVVL
jgi:nitrous oxidase accessory protein NosD